MGDRIQVIAGIIFALAFAAILAAMNSSVLSVGVNVNDQMSRTYANNEMYELDTLSQNAVSGATVISAIKNYDVVYSYNIEILVNTEGYKAAYGANVTNDSSYQRDAVYTDTSSRYYIDPQAEFKGEIIKNGNGVVTSIEFTQL